MGPNVSYQVPRVEPLEVNSRSIPITSVAESFLDSRRSITPSPSGSPRSSQNLQVDANGNEVRRGRAPAVTFNIIDRSERKDVGPGYSKYVAGSKDMKKMKTTKKTSLLQVWEREVGNERILFGL
ncbi:unnamed protein product [Lactuca virosa]|uniref:Uncharacterized protein n=1 Tax=Lactuca virosa TaxID=75947 RepID=A0AAU9PKT6_9ASTR|nr:unnamed protein product [Lactuca virosa]